MVEQRFRTPALQKFSKTSLLGKVSHALSIAENAHPSSMLKAWDFYLEAHSAEYSPPMRHNVPLTGLCYVS